MTSKKQINEIAIMWSASMLINVGNDSFMDDAELTEDDEVVNKVHMIAQSLAGNRPIIGSLAEIIKYVKNTVQ